ncbi:hypothetical protein AVEN_131789-1 [Araneus ventricosus]|uniref:Uncharacterized protein n=1 Tax=Araneus ventricosus TaxID=182803 RepID=A0A4Y2G535_ARAVE|nr:hypothetical protein AVEN_131789-1 [Araneus ventricosus]
MPSRRVFFLLTSAIPDGGRHIEHLQVVTPTIIFFYVTTKKPVLPKRVDQLYEERSCFRFLYLLVGDIYAADTQEVQIFDGENSKLFLLEFSRRITWTYLKLCTVLTV